MGKIPNFADHFMDMMASDSKIKKAVEESDGDFHYASARDYDDLGFLCGDSGASQNQASQPRVAQKVATKVQGRMKKTASRQPVEITPDYLFGTTVESLRSMIPGDSGDYVAKYLLNATDEQEGTNKTGSSHDDRDDFVHNIGEQWSLERVGGGGNLPMREDDTVYREVTKHASYVQKESSTPFVRASKDELREAGYKTYDDFYNSNAINPVQKFTEQSRLSAVDIATGDNEDRDGIFVNQKDVYNNDDSMYIDSGDVDGADGTRLSFRHRDMTKPLFPGAPVFKPKRPAEVVEQTHTASENRVEAPTESRVVADKPKVDRFSRLQSIVE